ncbi:hypothetical protein HPP92_019248 [Vanilla planifolia]|uniref:ZF-HD dimerization-type domain-containing protein n=1 Tax=Vanilla planifolia TaxID=51239 RepID=A0A835UJ55_VANPL|nr:hypothetical protein HPP92_019248 [Vanilla planifolia]
MGPQPEPDSESKGFAQRKGKAAVRYGECRKNHAASIGGYAVDGCLEFMASGEEGTAAALHCAACTCHRSYHRRESDVEYHSSLRDYSSTSTTTSSSSSSHRRLLE